MKLEFNKIDITDTLAVLCLGIGFIISVLFGSTELAGSIATGFFGYIGGIASGSSKQSNSNNTINNKTEKNENIDLNKK